MSKKAHQAFMLLVKLQVTHAVKLCCVCVCGVWMQSPPKKEWHSVLERDTERLPIVRPWETPRMSEVNGVNGGKGGYAQRDRGGGRMSHGR